MAVMAAVFLAPLELDDIDLAGSILCLNFGGYGLAFEQRGPDRNVFTVGNKQHLVQINCAAGFDVQLLNAYDVTFGDPVLFASGAYYRVHDHSI